MRKLLVGLLGIGLCLSTASPALAAFPGANGKIAFGTDRNGNQEIYSMTAAGGSQTNLTNNPEWDRSPAWSADGGAIAFGTDPAGAPRQQIYRMNADGTGQTRVSTIDVWAYDEPSWSPDGTRIVAHANRDPGSGASQFDIVAMNADGTNETVLTFDNSGLDVDPAWSPEGDRIAFSSRRGASSMDIYVMGADGSSPVELTDDLGSEGQPNWSPDGQKLVFIGTECPIGIPCTYSIKVINANGTGEVTLASSSSTELFSPAWSPDGSKIVYQRFFPSNQAIHVMNADGSGDTQIGGNPAQDTDPDWQPLVTGYPRPKGATPLRVALVPAFDACTSPDRTHGPPLAFPSCASPSQASPNLTVGSPDANGATANFQGLVRLDARAGTPGPPEDSSVPVGVALTDVRCQAGVTTCGAANSGGGADYIGEVQLRLDLRITDKYNATAPGGGFDPATVNDLPLSVPVLCFENTTATNIGSTCSVNTEMDFFYPGISKDTRRTIWEVGGVRLFDGGPDGDVDTADNSLFAVQGLFVP